MGTDDQDVFDLFAGDKYSPPMTPLPWYSGAKMDLDDYGRCLLRHLPRGRVNAVDGKLLARSLNLPWEENEFPFRKLIRRLVLERGWPIGTTSKSRSTGFYLIDAEADLETYTELLEKRAKAILEHREAILAGWDRRVRSKDEGRNWPLPR